MSPSDDRTFRDKHLSDLDTAPPTPTRRGGDEPRELWEWLEVRDKLAALPDMLRVIGRDDPG